MLAPDADSVAKLFSDAAEAAHWSARDLMELIATGTRVWVAEEDGRAVGAIAARVVAGEAELLNLAVAAKSRRNGIGRALVREVLEYTVASRARRVFLEVRSSNRGAQAFYLRLGFSQDGRRRNYYQNPSEDALLLSRPVPQIDSQTT
jgi:ribosomal-protein-alanine acetyltransferase